MLCSEVCVSGDLWAFEYTWPCCPFLVFFFRSRNHSWLDSCTLHLIFPFSIWVPHLSSNREEESTTRALEAENLARQVVCVPSPLEEMGSGLLGWLGSRTDRAAFMSFLYATVWFWSVILMQWVTGLALENFMPNTQTCVEPQWSLDVGRVHHGGMH